MKQTKRNDQKRWFMIKNAIPHMLCVLRAASLTHFLFLEWPQLHCLKNSHFYFKAKFTLAGNFSNPSFCSECFWCFAHIPFVLPFISMPNGPICKGHFCLMAALGLWTHFIILLLNLLHKIRVGMKRWGTEILGNWHPSGCWSYLLSITLMLCSAGMFFWDNFEACALLCFVEFFSL